MSSASLCLLLVSAEQKNITAESGQDVTLTCQTPDKNSPIIAVEWCRADLQPEYVLFYRDEQLNPANQHPSFKNRVDLQDRHMKDGDVFLIVKNVTPADSGTYECHVAQRETNQKRAMLKLISSISLSVVDPPGPSGATTEDGPPTRLIVGLSVGAVLLAAVAAAAVALSV